MIKRRNMLIALELVLVVVCSVLMYVLQSHLFYINARREISLTFDEMGRILDQASASTNEVYDSYEMIHVAKAKMARFYIRNDEDTIYTVSSMKHLNDLLGTYNVFIVDAQGSVKFTAIPSSIRNFEEIIIGEDTFYNWMLDIRGTGNASEVGFCAAEDDEDYEDEETVENLHSLCAAYLSNGDYVVVEDDAKGLMKQQDVNGSWDVVLPRITLGKNGFVFSISDEGFVNAFSYAGEETVTDVTELGITMDQVTDGFIGTLNLLGNNFYCGIEHYEAYESYIICAIPSEEITSNVIVVTALPLFVAFVFLSLQLLYSLMLIGEPGETDEHGKKESLRMFLFRKMAVLLVLAILFSVVSSLCPQMLYAMYLQADSNMKEADALDDLLTANEEIQKQTRERYYKDLENLTALAAKFISNNPAQITRQDLGIIARNLGAEHILLYNKMGTVFLSDAYYSGLKLSNNPEDLSYEFRKVLTGTPVLAQNKVDKTFLDAPYRYVGAIVTDSKNELNGFVQLLFSPDFLSASLSESVVKAIPATFSGRNNAYAFIADSETGNFVYYPKEELIDKPLQNYGITEDMKQDGYFSRVWFDGENRLLYCDFWEKDMIFTVASIGPIAMESISRGVFISLVGILIQLLFFIGMLLMNRERPLITESEGADQWTIEDQKKLVERLAAGRISRLLRISFFAFSGVVSVTFILKDILFRNNKALNYLFNGYWNKGIHVFSVTACCLVVCIVYFSVSLILLILELTGRLMNSRGETIVRMLISFIRYITVISLVFYCANLLGAPTGTLLASAGILTIVIGLGAQKLVTDILAGLFIIFERVYKVGDIIMIDGESWRGRVLEIGIRNTRVMDIDANTIRILHNSELNQIINMSELPTCVYTTIGTEYGDKLLEIEEIINKELPEMHERIKGAIEGPIYKGVTELGDSAVVLKFMTKCRNEDYHIVRYAMNRELKLLFDKYDINVPFPQVVINERETENK